MLPLFITTSQVEQWKYVKFFCKLEKWASRNPFELHYSLWK